jgi:putative acetyltransferase
MSLMSIRLYRSEDGPPVRKVVEAVYKEYSFTWDPDTYHADLYDIENCYMTGGSRFWVAEHQGEIVGCAGLLQLAPLPGKAGETIVHNGTVRAGAADCELMRLYVLDSARGLGLGKALTKTVINQARSNGLTVMEIWSDKLFKEAHSLYERFGAKMIGDRICDDPDEAPEWGMVIELQKDKDE